MALYGNSTQASPNFGGPNHFTPPMGQFPGAIGASPVARGYGGQPPMGGVPFGAYTGHPGMASQMNQHQQNQQLHLQQVQQQLASLKMNGATDSAARGTGATLSNNLWQ